MEPNSRSISRRQLLQLGGAGAAGLGLLALLPQARAAAMGMGMGMGMGIDGGSSRRGSSGPSLGPIRSLRTFNQGSVVVDNGQRIRRFELEARSLTVPLGAGVMFKAWSLNGQVPGPTLRAQQGERIRVVFRNGDNTSHSLHFHGVHPAEMDGVTPVLQGRSTIYEFDLPRAGLYPYHCHVQPVTRHVGKGMYGLLVVDPPKPRPAADELVLVMGGYDLDNDGRNELYAFNGIPDIYMRQPIQIRQNALVRLYLLNMVELDPPLTFHLHANEFAVVGQGSAERTDVITLGTAERAILEFRYPYSGQYMFHPHQDAIAERGCMGLFDVTAS